MKNERASLGQRIRAAREALDWSQGKLADAVGFNSAQIISSIESEHRQVKAWELARIASALHRSVGELLGFATSMQPLVLWRERPEVVAKEVEARFLERCRRFWLLEEWCGVSARKSLAPLNVNLGSVSYERIGQEAQRIWSELDLGNRPGLLLAKTLEEDYAVKIFYDDLGQQGSALCATGEFGRGILLNSAEKLWRRNFSLAHELFHLLTQEKINEAEAIDPEKRERLANIFASAVLLPAPPLLQAVDSRVRNKQISYVDLVEVAREFAVSTEALLWRLANFGMITPESVRQVLGDANFRAIDKASFPKESESPPRLPERYQRLCYLAYRKGRLTSARLADFLECDLADLTQELAGLGAEGAEEDAEAGVSVA